jgi:Domain of unknown function (DUF4262)
VSLRWCEQAMFTALDADASTLDEHETNFVTKIRKHGWLQTSVFEDEVGPGFCYTTGFWIKFNFPELITFSLKGAIAHDTFWNMYRDLESGQSFPIGEPIDSIFQNLPAVLLTVSESRFEDYLGWSRWFYGGNKFRCLQLVWADPNGKFPWQTGFSSEMINDQPDLTEANWSGLRQH